VVAYKRLAGIIAVIFINLALLIVVIVAVWYQTSKEAKEPVYSDILTRFDDKELDQLDDVINRYKDGKGGYLMLIPPVVDGGYWIYEYWSNGRELKWTVDNSRDGMSGSDRGVRVYSCKAMDKEESAEDYWVVLSECEGYAPEEKLYIFGIDKNR